MTALPHHQDHNGTLITMLVIAALIHGLLILGIGFDLPKPETPARQQSLDVILIPPKKHAEKPEKADFLAPTSQKGGSDRKGHARPRAVPTRPALKKSQRAEVEQIRSGAPTTEPRRQPKVVSTPRPAEKKVVPVRRKPVKAKPRTDIAQLLSSTRQEIARLTAQLDRDSRYASQKVRRKAINASTREYRYAAYLEAWRRKVERVGNLNYPDAARRRKLYGDLLLHVAVRADGSVADIRVVRSSGHKVLDDAAVRIVRLAAPFAPFPEEIRKEVDILDITRTWQFMSNNRLFSR